MLLSTTMKHSDTEKHFKVPTAQVELFATLPAQFTTADALKEASVRSISRSSVFRMLKITQKYGFLASPSKGYYIKTSLGKDITSTDVEL